MSVEPVVNVENINRVIRALRTDTLHPFDMRVYANCIAGFASRELRCSKYYDGIKRAFGISEKQAIDLTLPPVDSRYFDATREQAILVLENLRDSGIVDWEYACPSFRTKVKNFIESLVTRR